MAEYRDNSLASQDGWVNALARYLAPEQGDTYGNILPIARDGETNALRLALPMAARDAINNLAYFADAPRAAYAGEINPMDPNVQQRLAVGAFDAIGGGMAYKSIPKEAIGRNALRYAKDESGALNYKFGHDYQSGHSAPLRGKDSASLDNLAGDIYPDDIYSSSAAQYYGTGDSAVDRKTIQIMQKVRGNPDALVTIYRAVPNDVNDINAGDWVTVNKDYAKQHAKYWADGEAKILEEKVRAGDLFTDGNSIHEFGWSPE